MGKDASRAEAPTSEERFSVPRKRRTLRNELKAQLCVLQEGEAVPAFDFESLFSEDSQPGIPDGMGMI